jgi:hypothetical protein
VTGDSGRAVWLGQACSYVRGADAVLAPLIEPEDAERDSIITQATELKGWPPEIDDQVLEEDVRVARAAAVLAPARTSKFGAIYEIRTYTYGTGFMPQVIERWAEKIPRRMLSPFIGRLPDDHRPQTQLVHIWAYRDAAGRQRIRTRAIATGAWPPKHARREGMRLRKQNILTIPASFSPLR